MSARPSVARRRPLSLWRLEWLRLSRSGRLVALLAVYAFFGVVGPLTARYLGEIVQRAGTEGVVVQFPDPVPADGLIQYGSNASQIGLLVTVLVAAAALAFDANPEMAAFLRSRVPRMVRLVVPRVVLPAAAAAVAWTLGAVLATYETAALIGMPDVAGVVAGVAYGAAFHVFAVCVVAAVAGLLRRVAGVTVVSLVVLIGLAIAGSLAGEVGRFSPSALLGALGPLAAGAPAGDYVGSLVVAAVSCVGLVAFATWRLDRRER